MPYVVVWGDRESLEAVSVRRRGGEQSVTSAEALAEELEAAARL